MKSNKDFVDFLRVGLISYATQELAKLKKIEYEEALRIIMSSKTYNLMYNDESMLWTESPEYLLDMITSELEGDMANWLDI